jgi:hypothetical protein
MLAKAIINGRFRSGPSLVNLRTTLRGASGEGKIRRRERKKLVEGANPRIV